MSGDAFPLPPAPIMTSEKARDVGRAYEALASHLTELGMQREAGAAMRDSQRWMTYSASLAQAPPAERST